jgi:NAD(P)-dependent dehydrogenase (short-subunit alcohol dehydrogenase family)
MKRVEPRYQDKVVLVTGAAAGLGAACARRLAREGARVALLDLHEARGLALQEELKALGAQALFIATDITQADAVEAAVQRTVQVFGGLDVAVNNAGMGGPLAPLLDLPEAQWHQTLALNLTGVFHSLRAELRVMQARGGAIVNMASVFGSVGGAGVSAYTATKHGVIGLTKSAALEYGPRGVRINAVAPTFVRTDLTAGLDEAAWAHLASLHALGRFPSVDEVAATVAWLGSDDAAACTGSVYLVDAGYTAN